MAHLSGISELININTVLSLSCLDVSAWLSQTAYVNTKRLGVEFLGDLDFLRKFDSALSTGQSFVSQILKMSFEKLSVAVARRDPQAVTM